MAAGSSSKTPANATTTVKIFAKNGREGKIFVGRLVVVRDGSTPDPEDISPTEVEFCFECMTSAVTNIGIFQGE